MTNKTQNLREWEKRFDDEFKYLGEDSYDINRKGIKTFIATLLSSSLDELAGEIEGMRKYHKEFECNGAHGGKGCYETFCEDQNCRNAPKEYNQALSDVLTLIKSKQ